MLFYRVFEEALKGLIRPLEAFLRPLRKGQEDQGTSKPLGGPLYNQARSARHLKPPK